MTDERGRAESVSVVSGATPPGVTTRGPFAQPAASEALLAIGAATADFALPEVWIRSDFLLSENPPTRYRFLVRDN